MIILCLLGDSIVQVMVGAMSLTLSLSSLAEKEGEYDVVIIGGGPAGLTAGIYLGRLGLKPVIVEREALGGRMVNAPVIEDYPGVNSISGRELAEIMVEQAEKFNVRTIFPDEAVSFDLYDTIKTVKTRRGRVLRSPAIIIATGLSRKPLGIIGEQEYFGRGVSYCAICDAPFFKGKPLALIGYDDHALEEAVYLTSIASEVHIIPDNPIITASRRVLDTLKASGNVRIYEGYNVKEVVGDGVKVTGVKVVSPSGEVSTINVSGVFIAKGEAPTTDLLARAGINVDEKGFIIVNNRMETNVKGVYAAGDVTGIAFQIVVAAGQGAIAALEAFKYVKRVAK